jgi:hypothetical protein
MQIINLAPHGQSFQGQMVEFRQITLKQCDVTHTVQNIAQQVPIFDLARDVKAAPEILHRPVGITPPYALPNAQQAQGGQRLVAASLADVERLPEGFERPLPPAITESDSSRPRQRPSQ